jgi:hypothetical protein
VSWCLATSLADKEARIAEKCAKRRSIECSFRDTKDPGFGMGMGQIRISPPERRDRSWLNAVAVALLTLLGALSEALGLDRSLAGSTTLFRQSRLRYQLVPATQQVRSRCIKGALI